MGVWEVVGWAGSALVVWSLLQARILRLRAYNLIGGLLLVAFNAAVSLWSMVALNVALSAINVWHLWRLLSSRHDSAVYGVVEVGVGDPFLGHLLTVHAPDIQRFNPGFRIGATVSDRTAFLIVRRDETVGVMVVRDLGDGVAQVELDYVTPRFRDFTPGEFVFRRSRLLTERGFRRVLTPPGMVSPYYERLGFAPAGDRFALDLAI
ncbi:hypothetical protein [Pilimelia columellifera]|uniref:N-acetyltransferase domain-containing protein n=1 Tax=Pilimelia columellifera subsp. columellifera TaxID=706583 RepID=A0ABN3NM24_9ACTN